MGKVNGKKPQKPQKEQAPTQESRINVILPPGVRARAEKRAALENRSLNNWIGTVIQQRCNLDDQIDRETPVPPKPV